MRKTDRRVRRAGVNVKLLVGLGVAVLLTVGFWVWKAVSSASEKDAVRADGMRYFVACVECGVETEVTVEKSKKVERDAEGKLKCPACGKFAGMWDREEARKIFAAKGKTEASKASGFLAP